VLKDTFSNISTISWRPLLVVEEAGVPGEYHRPWARATGKLYHLRLRVECTLFGYLQSRARTHIKGSYPQKLSSIWVLNNLFLVSEIPSINNKHRLYEHFAKTTFKLDEKAKPLTFWKFALFGLFRSSLSRKP
jgi:hypothetical protein